jgi:glutathione S-transferase
VSDATADDVLEVWGRADSSAVARVLWTIGELRLPVRRRDWGGSFGGNDDPAYRAMQPAGRIPAVRLPGGAALWESNAVIRYLTATHDPGGLMPADPVERAQAEAWMDWSAAFAGSVDLLRSAYRREDASTAGITDARRRAAPTFAVLERALTDRRWLMGDALTIADLALGVWGHRLHRCPDEVRPDDLPAVNAWLARLRARPAYDVHVVRQVSVRPQRVGMRT